MCVKVEFCFLYIGTGLRLMRFLNQEYNITTFIRPMDVVRGDFKVTSLLRILCSCKEKGHLIQTLHQLFSSSIVGQKPIKEESLLTEYDKYRRQGKALMRKYNLNTYDIWYVY